MNMDVELTDGVIRMRPCRMEDAEVIYAAVRESIREVSRWAPWCSEAYALSDAVNWLAELPGEWSRGRAYHFAVFDAGDDAFLGGCSLSDIDPVHNYANLGYWIRSSRAGGGTATAAVRLIARFGLEEAGLSRLEIVAAVGNRASQRVAEKAGAMQEGVQRNQHLVHGRLHDCIMYSLVPADLEGWDEADGERSGRDR